MRKSRQTANGLFTQFQLVTPMRRAAPCGSLDRGLISQLDRRPPGQRRLHDVLLTNASNWTGPKSGVNQLNC